MSDQSNIAEYYPAAKLLKLKELLQTRKSPFDKTTIANFAAAAKQTNIHKKLSPEFQEFLSFLDQFIKMSTKNLEPKVLEEEISNHFDSNPSPENTMWQIRSKIPYCSPFGVCSCKCLI